MGSLGRTSEQWEKNYVLYFAFKKIKPSYEDSVELSKGNQLRCVLPRQTQHSEWHHSFPEVIDTIARECVSCTYVTRQGPCSQGTNFNMHRRWWIIRRDRNRTTGLMASLRQFTYPKSNREIRPWQLNQGKLKATLDMTNTKKGGSHSSLRA